MSARLSEKRLPLAIGLVLAVAVGVSGARADEQTEPAGGTAATSGEAGTTTAGGGAPAEGGAAGGEIGGATGGIGGAAGLQSGGRGTPASGGGMAAGGMMAGGGWMGPAMGAFFGASSADTTLEEAIDLATRLNPKVLLAQAKVAEAQALLSQTQLAVAADVAQLFQSRETLLQDYELQRRALGEKLTAARTDAERLKKLGDQNVVSLEEREKAQNSVRVLEIEGRRLAVAHQRELERIESSLMQLIGSRPRFYQSAGEVGAGWRVSAFQQGRSGSQGGAGGGGSPSGQDEAATKGESTGGEGAGAAADAAEGATSTDDQYDFDTNTARGFAASYYSPRGLAGSGFGAGGLGTTGAAGSMSGLGTGTMMGRMGMAMEGAAGPAGEISVHRPAIPEQQRHLREELEKQTQLDVQNQPLDDIVALLKTQHAIEIQIGPGITPDQPITMRVNNVKFKDLLLLLTDLYPDLCFVVRDYGLLITTRERGMQLYGPAIPADLPLRVAPPAQ